MIIEKVNATITKYGMITYGDNILVGLSGGPDSVCLLHILNKIKNKIRFNLSAAYIDHRLRPSETPSEIEFCNALCNSLSISFQTMAVDVKSYSLEKGINKQEAARELRYDALYKIATEIGANKIALGHNADDQAETILMRLFRGSGPAGISGIPPIRSLRSKIHNFKIDIIRPLIEIERKEIEEFLKKEDIRFLMDSSNLKTDYLRNSIRQFIMPFAKNINKDFTKTISKTAEILRDEERYFDIQVTKALMKLIPKKTENTIELFLSPLESMDSFLLRRVLRRAIDETKGLRGISFINIENILNLIKSGISGDRIYLPKNIRVIKGYSTLIITSEKPTKLGTYSIGYSDEVILKESSIVLRSEIMDISEVTPDSYKQKDKNTAFIDADKVRFPLTIRKRMQGDYFYPLGLGKRKKLQDYFVDEKIHRDERDIIPIITSDNTIVWIAGHRLDERYKVDDNTKKVLKLKINPMKA